MILFAALFYLWYRKRNAMPDGLVFGIFLVALFSLRFAGEFFKVNQEPFENHLLLNMGQVLSIPFILTGLYLVSTRYEVRGTK